MACQVQRQGQEHIGQVAGPILTADCGREGTDRRLVHIQARGEIALLFRQEDLQGFQAPRGTGSHLERDDMVFMRPKVSDFGIGVLLLTVLIEQGTLLKRGA